MFSFLSSSGTSGRAKKTKKRNTKDLTISSPTGFQHLYHFSSSDFHEIGPAARTPRLNSYERPRERHSTQEYNRSQSQGPPVMARTLPRNIKLSQAGTNGTMFSPLDHIVHTITDDQLRDSARIYYNRKSRPSLPQWDTRLSPPNGRPRGASQGNIIVNPNYMTCPTTGGSSDYGTMTDSMGSRRSTGSTSIMNSVYLDRESLERYKTKENVKGILKTTDKQVDPEGRLYQQAFTERNLPNNSVGKRIRSSTELRAMARSASPSPLTRPSILEMTPAQSELSLTEVTATPQVIPTEDTKTPLTLSCAQSISVLIKDDRPVSAKVRGLYEAVPQDEDEDLEGTVIIHL